MKTLNFFPFYEPYLLARTKTTTFRLPPRETLSPGDEVMLTVGWTEVEAKRLHKARISTTYERAASDLRSEDFEGESPDCQEPEATRLVLGAIYRRIVAPTDQIWIIKFKHLD